MNPELRARLESRFADAQRLLLLQKAEEAEDLAREVLATMPKSRRAMSLLGEILLMQGRYPEGWAAHEQREHRATTPAWGLPFSEWDGAPLAGRSILVWGEQGIGDEIQMARFVPALKARGASRVSFACLPVNVRAFAPLADQVFSRSGGDYVRVPNHDLWVLSGSLPHRLGVTVENLSGDRFLDVSGKRSGGVGLVARGNPANPRDRFRSVPEDLLRRTAPQGRLLEPSGDLLDSLATVAGLDLLITVDTSWAHMAGALGVPCWVLLPFEHLDWRWMRRRSDSPWYWSLRLFRQSETRDWTAVLQDVEAALASEIR